LSEALNPLFQAALHLQEFCQSQNWRFCFIGGLAVQRWGQPRFTKDADLTLLTGFGREASFVDTLLNVFPGRRADAREFALRYRVLLLKEQTGISFDIALGALPFEENCVGRATLWPVSENASLLTCSADDLIVHKAFAARDVDWSDVESILMRQGNKLNFDLIWSELRPLIELKEDPAIETRLRTLMARCL